MSAKKHLHIIASIRISANSCQGGWLTDIVASSPWLLVAER